jgi:hypothetical protein
VRAAPETVTSLDVNCFIVAVGKIAVSGNSGREATVMRTSLKSLAVVSAVSLVPLSYPISARAFDALAYQQASRMCALGDPRACIVVQQYRSAMAYPGMGGAPADRWVSPQELPYVRPGILSHRDFLN